MLNRGIVLKVNDSICTVIDQNGMIHNVRGNATVGQEIDIKPKSGRVLVRLMSIIVAVVLVSASSVAFFYNRPVPAPIDPRVTVILDDPTPLGPPPPVVESGVPVGLYVGIAIGVMAILGSVVIYWLIKENKKISRNSK